MHYQPMTDADKKLMLQEIGVRAFEDLVKGIPAALRNPKMNIREALSELEVQGLIRELLSKNRATGEYLSFLGGGSYEHFIPAAVAQIAGRNEFYTAYTPYQPEASQGTLQVIYEFQSMITELTGLDVSNGSHYDGSTSVAEAALLALRHTDRTKIFVADSVHPHYREVLRTYFKGTPYELKEFKSRPDGTFDRAAMIGQLDDKVAGVLVQSPNFFGIVEDLEGFSDELHEAGTLLLMTGHPLAYTVYKSPGEWGADVACGEGQPLGIPLQFGGPYVGYFSTTRALMRRIPGRLAGMTLDADGKRAFCLTLQAREQHIRRERAASNICTNQALCALAACVYMTLLGKEGIREVSEINVDRSFYLRQKISKLPGYHADVTLPVFNEFVVRSDQPFKNIQEKLLSHKIFAGVDLEEYYPDRKNEFLVCATETKSRKDLDRFVEVLSSC